MKQERNRIEIAERAPARKAQALPHVSFSVYTSIFQKEEKKILLKAKAAF